MGRTGTELAPFKGRKPGTAVQSCLVVGGGGRGSVCHDPGPLLAMMRIARIDTDVQAAAPPRARTSGRDSANG